MPMLNTETSQRLFEEARTHIPGGVNSPVRAFGQVGGTPLFIDRAEGPYMWDADGNRYIDYIGSWGPMILGHGHPEVLRAVQDTMARGFSFGAPTGRETALAKKVTKLVPSMEMMRFVSSGTEACMSALRVARAVTGRDKIIKFNGCYHGHADMLLVKAGSGIATLGIPGSPGVPKETTMHTLVAPFNDLAAVEALFAENPGAVAAVIIEPIVGNAGFIRPMPGYLEGLRRITRGQGALLIFDEVMTGFRVHPGGVQGLTGVTPDLTTLGKVVGGGLPIAAYGGRKDIMNAVAPVGPVYQAGTLSGNPLAVASGLKTLEILETLDFKALGRLSRRLVQGLAEAARAAKVPFSGDSEGGMFGFNFRAEAITSFADAQASDIPLFNKFFHAMLRRGVYLAPSAYEAGFVSFAHSDALIDETVRLARDAFAEITK